MRFQSAFFTLIFLSFAVFVQGQQTFINVGPQLGISGIIGLGHSVSWGDINNDGYPDLGLGDQTWNGYWFFRNDSNAFVDITTAAGLSGMSANKTIIAEFTGDKFNDLLIRNMDGLGEYSTLFENNGGTSFTNITYLSMLPDTGIYNVADFNNDGNLDVLSLDILDWGNLSLQFGNGDGTFQPLMQIDTLWGYSPLAVFDYDRDGFMDIFWPADAGLYHPTTLLKNNGDSTFTNVTDSCGIVFNIESASMDIGDINNDGYIDIYIGGKSFNPGKLFLNNGNGTFTDISTSSGIFTGQTDVDRSATFGDFDNDGWLDLFLCWKLVPNQLFRNNGNNTFTDVADSLGLTGGSHIDFFGSGWADYNNDCAIDLFAAGHFDPWVLFENQNCLGNGLFVTLEGTNSNFNAIGARGDLWINGQRISRNVLPDPGIQDFSDMKLHFGMDTATTADSLIIYWPSGIVKTYYNINSQQQCHIDILEDSCNIFAGINGTVAYCDAGTGGNLFDELGGTPDSTGIWTGPSILTNGILGTFDLTTNVSGTYTYIVSAPDCQASIAYVVVTIEAIPDAGFNGEVTYCSNEAGSDLFTELGGTPMGTGTWYPVLASGTGVFNPLLDSEGTYYYSVSGIACPSTLTSSVLVTVDTVDVTTSLSGFTIISNSATGTYQWMDCNMPSIIAGEISNSYTATANGNYAVIVTDNGCVDTSECVDITIFEIVEFEFDDEISIYPNPTSGILTIDMVTNNEAMLLTIYDANAKLINTHTVSGQIFTIDLSEFEKGVYVITLSVNNKQAIFKVIRE